MSQTRQRQDAEILRLDNEVERLRKMVYDLQHTNRRLIWFVEHLPRQGWGSSEVAVWTEFRRDMQARCD
jgi:hypothetical protein